MSQISPETLIEKEDEAKATLPEPTEEQAKAVDDFFKFMLSDNKEFHLEGPAGTGKTFTLQRIMDEGMERYEQAAGLLGIPQTITEIALTATTNKAAEVLAIATGKPTMTIHGYMGFKVSEDFQTGETRITVPPGTVPIHNRLIIIDEASMIDHKLYDLLHKYTHNCKFLYTSDYCQMAPVFEDMSKIYNSRNHFAQLTKPMRNSGQPALMALCKQWRETVETGVFKPIVPVPGVIDYYEDEQMDDIIQNMFVRDDNPDARIMCYSNTRVKEYNNYIRELRGLPNYFETGETLVNASAFTRGQVNFKVEEEIYVVENPYEESVQKVQGTEFDTYELKIRTKKGIVADVLVPSDPNHFQQLIKHFQREKNWSGYFYLKQQFPDLRPKDASTVYKAQGSTYDKVIIDLDNINKCTHASQVARMMYVAVSRPRSKIILYGRLKKSYSGG